jgi:Protein of unknown function (DUF1275)
MTKPGELPYGSANGRGLDPAASLVLAGLLAALAGIVDSIGYLHLRGLFVSFMSGNSTQLAAALGQGELTGVATIAELIALFVLGAAAGRRLRRETASDPGADRCGDNAGDRRRAGGGFRADGHRDGGAQRLDGPRRKYPGQLDFRHRCAGQVRSRSRRFSNPARIRMELAETSLALGRAHR